MMRTVDERLVQAPAERMFRFARDVEQWPTHLRHYRSVRLLQAAGTPMLVDMRANRPFGVFNWPTWWVSEMWVDEPRLEVRYRHVRGITTGMDVVWRLEPRGTATHVSIIHTWNGPRWPLLRRPAAEWVIGPVFVHGIASRTLAGLAHAAEREAA
jgi:ribosome-associated toxin RatA of RatAB toxin-antitoxin module